MGTTGLPMSRRRWWVGELVTGATLAAAYLALLAADASVVYLHLRVADEASPLAGLAFILPAVLWLLGLLCAAAAYLSQRVLLHRTYRAANRGLLLLAVLGPVLFVAGLVWSTRAHTSPPPGRARIGP